MNEDCAGLIHSINFTRIDIIPNRLTADLCSGSARKVLGSALDGIVRYKYFTLKYTRSLYIQLYIRKPFDSDSFRRHSLIVRRCIKKLNSVKRSKVIGFDQIKIRNLQGSGKFSTFHHTYWQKINVPTEIVTEIGTDHTEPTLFIKQTDLIHHTYRFVVLKYKDGNILKINNTGSFTLVTQNLEEYERLLYIVINIAKQITVWKNLCPKS